MSECTNNSGMAGKIPSEYEVIFKSENPKVKVRDWDEIKDFLPHCDGLSEITFTVIGGNRILIKNISAEKIKEVEVYTRGGINIVSLNQVATWGKSIDHLKVNFYQRYTIGHFVALYKKPDNVKKLTYVYYRSDGIVNIRADNNTQDIGFENIKVKYTRIVVDGWDDINMFLNNHYKHATDITFVFTHDNKEFKLRGIGYTNDKIKIQEVDCCGITPPDGDFLAGPPLEIGLIKIGNMGFVHKIHDDMARITVKSIHVNTDDMDSEDGDDDSYMYTNEDWDRIKLIIAYEGSIKFTLPANKPSDVYKGFIEYCNPTDKDLKLTFVANPTVVIRHFNVYENTKLIDIVIEHSTNDIENVLNVFMPVTNARLTQPHIKIRVRNLDFSYADKCLTLFAQVDGCIIESVTFSEYGDDARYIKFVNVRRTSHPDEVTNPLGDPGQYTVEYVRTNIKHADLLQNILYVTWRVKYRELRVDTPVEGMLRGINIDFFKNSVAIRDNNIDYLKLKVFEIDGKESEPTWFLEYKVDTIHEMLALVRKLHNAYPKPTFKINATIVSIRVNGYSRNTRYTLQDGELQGLRRTHGWIKCVPRLQFPAQIDAAAEEEGHEEGAYGYSWPAVATRLIL